MDGERYSRQMKIVEYQRYVVMETPEGVKMQNEMPTRDTMETFMKAHVAARKSREHV